MWAAGGTGQERAEEWQHCCYSGEVARSGVGDLSTWRSGELTGGFPFGRGGSGSALLAPFQGLPCLPVCVSVWCVCRGVREAVTLSSAPSGPPLGTRSRVSCLEPWFSPLPARVAPEPVPRASSAGPAPPAGIKRLSPCQRALPRAGSRVAPRRPGRAGGGPTVGLGRRGLGTEVWGSPGSPVPDLISS